MPDVMKIKILDDGTIKSYTEQISAPNHQNAEQFGRMLAALMGGDAPVRVPRAHVHQHEHEHEHE